MTDTTPSRIREADAVYTLTANGGFTASFTEKTISENIRILHRNALIDWGLDGFKPDFIDSFRQMTER